MASEILNLGNLLTKLGVDTSELRKGDQKHKQFTRNVKKRNKDTARTHKDLDRGISNNIKSYAKLGVGIGLASVAMKKFVDLGVQGVKAYADLDRHVRTTGQLLKATGNAAGKSIRELDAQARSIGRATLASTNQVRKAQNILLTFKGIGGSIFDGLLESAQDFATILGTDITQTTQQLAKAFEDPATNLSNLRRIGISFSEDQKEQIKNLQDQNKLYEAQKVLLKVLQGQSKGAGKAAARGTAGLFDTLAEENQQLKEVIGGIIAESDAFKSALTLLINMTREAAFRLDDVFGTGTLRHANMTQQEMRDRRAFLQEQIRSGAIPAGGGRNPAYLRAVEEIQGLDKGIVARANEGALKAAQAQRDIYARQSFLAKQARERALRESKERGFGTLQDPDYTPFAATGVRSNFALGLTNLPNVVDDPDSPTGKRIDRRISAFGVKDRYESETRRKNREDQAAADKRSERLNAKTNAHMSSLTHLFNLEQEQRKKTEEAEEAHQQKMTDLQKAQADARQKWYDKWAQEDIDRQKRKASVMEAIGLGSLNTLIGFEKMTTESSQQAFTQQMQMFGNTLGQMSGLSKRHFQIYKNFQTAQATIAGIAAAVHSFNFGTQTGGPWLGAALATVSGIATGAQIAMIQAQEFTGRRAGGMTQAGRMYRVNEAGVEMFSAKGKDYMLSGSNGRVTPANQISSGSSTNEVKVILHYDPQATQISASQNREGNIELQIEGLENIMADRIVKGKSRLQPVIKQVANR